MKRFWTAALITVAMSGAAAAQDIGGNYTVQGTNFDGSPYSGEATISITSNTTCEIVWITGSTSSKGFCMRNDDAFAAGYVMGDQIGLIIYKSMPDGSMKGLWTIRGKNGLGTEILTPK